MLPKDIFGEYEKGINYKAALGSRGMFEQDKINERFYAGDQWHGAKCGSDRPLVRHNVIRRIGDYKIAVITAAPVSVCYSAEGYPETIAVKRETENRRDQMLAGTQAGPPPEQADRRPGVEEIALVMSALNDYFRVTAERVKFDDLKHDALKSAYLTGTGILYTYWDPDIKTGLYADEGRTAPIDGDIACELLDVENVYFGDPARDDVESQPYIILAQRRSVEELRREAKRNGRPKEDIDAIKPDQIEYMAGDRADLNQSDDRNCTVLTRLWKEWDKEGKSYKVMAMRVVRGAVIRKPWDLQIRRYPLAKFSWDKRKGSIYGDTELTYLIPNQIAINRMVTASVWAVMVMGMPLMVVNNEVVPQPITNDPGQIIRVNGTAEDVASAVRYVTPPSFSPNYDNSANSLINNTMTQAGANDAALGDMEPDNTSAIIALREAAAQPLQSYQNAFYSFIEDVARIWAEFWMCLYGKRSLKISDANGTWYLPFDGERYRDLVLSVRVDVGASPLWSETATVQTLDNLLDRQIITPEQYLKRLPKGVVPDVAGILKELSAPAAAMSAQAGMAGDGAQPVGSLGVPGDAQAAMPVPAGNTGEAGGAAAGGSLPSPRELASMLVGSGLLGGAGGDAQAAPSARAAGAGSAGGSLPSPKELAAMLVGSGILDGAGGDAQAASSAQAAGAGEGGDGQLTGSQVADTHAQPAEPAGDDRTEAAEETASGIEQAEGILLEQLCQLSDQALRRVVIAAGEQGEQAAARLLLEALSAPAAEALLQACGSEDAAAAALAALLRRLLDKADSRQPAASAAEAAAIAAIREQLPDSGREDPEETPGGHTSPAAGSAEKPSRRQKEKGDAV